VSSKVIVYSADWCGDCRRSKRLLDELKVEYHLIDVESDTAATEKVIEINGGYRSIPVILFEDGTHLTEPSDKALKQKLLELSLI
jgi:mycoredoxin